MHPSRYSFFGKGWYILFLALYLSQARSSRKQGGSILYERSDAHGCFAIYFFNPCLRVLAAWDKYWILSFTGVGVMCVFGDGCIAEKLLHFCPPMYDSKGLCPSCLLKIGAVCTNAKRKFSTHTKFTAVRRKMSFLILL